MSVGGINECWNVFSGNNEDMGWGLRSDVFHGKEPVRFSHNLRGNLPTGDPTEETLRGEGHRAYADAGASFVGSCVAASFAAFSLSVTQQRLLQKYFPLR